MDNRREPERVESGRPAPPAAAAEPVDPGVKILAREIYRSLRAEGLSNLEITVVVRELLFCAARDVGTK